MKAEGKRFVVVQDGRSKYDTVRKYDTFSCLFCTFIRTNYQDIGKHLDVCDQVIQMTNEVSEAMCRHYHGTWIGVARSLMSGQ
ncbi:hypothetical protein E2C01_067849 [Portunus trituberculatus]|uniref:Uncharacterized protein n=1 Tax=Portunus trituberculatus TaxID=210409 RepID=A0A5B7HW95_PORTR|nr:hypothetical protein [Portunus trituberculatus]